jgi:acetylornithine deacetylase/succinyl-diaminopimelate desuccinylase-like protein
MTSSVELTQDLVRFNTINPPGAERACAETLAALLKERGFTVDVVPFGDGRAQIVARIGGAQGNCRSDLPDISIRFRSARSRGRSTRTPAQLSTESSTAGARRT